MQLNVTMNRKSPSDSYMDAIRPIRNRLRRFSYASVLRQIADYLLSIHSAGQQQGQKLPWVAERLALWVLRDNDGQYQHRLMSRGDFEQCMNLAWDTMNSSAMHLGASGPFRLTLRQLYLPQLPHQSKLGLGAFARQVELLRRTEPSSRLRRHLNLTLEMSAETYLHIAILFWTMASGGVDELLGDVAQRKLWSAFQPDVFRRFLASVVVEHAAIHPQLIDIDVDEWFQPHVLSPFPIVQYRGNRYFMGKLALQHHLETVFIRAIRNSDDPELKQEYEKYLEAYVGEILEASGHKVLNGTSTRKHFSVQGECCDFAILGDDSVILVDVRSKALSDPLPAVPAINKLKTELTSTGRKARVRLDNVERHVLQHPDCRNHKVHKVAVTGGDLLIGQTQYLSGDESEDSAAPVLMSLDLLDRLLEAVRLRRCSLRGFLDDFEKRSEVPGQSSFSLESLINYEPYRVTEIPEHLKAILAPFFEELHTLPGLAEGLKFALFRSTIAHDRA